MELSSVFAVPRWSRFITGWARGSSRVAAGKLPANHEFGQFAGMNCRYRR